MTSSDTTTRRLVPDRVLTAPGPFVSLYLDTHAAVEQGDEELALRYKALREQAAEGGATPLSLDVLDGIVRRSHLQGDGLAVVLSETSVVIERHLARPISDSITFGPLPDLLPLIDWEQSNPSYAVVLADRTGAEIHVVHSSTITRSIDVDRDLDRHDVALPTGGGWSQRRFQRHAEHLWDANAKEVAEELGRIALNEELEFIFVAGDVSAVRHLKEHAANHVGALVVDVDVEPHSIDQVRDEIERTLAAVVARRDKDVLEKFQEQRGREDLATDGWETTMAALRMSQVGTLLVDARIDARTGYFVTSDPNQCSLDRTELEDLGLGEVGEAPAHIVAVRAALGTGASVHVIPSLGPDHAPREGVGAILRFGI